MCVENIFFKAKKLQMKILLGKSQVALRKCKGNSRSLNAGRLKSEGAIERLIHLDKGFQFLRALRGSPPYFENWDENCRLIQSDPVTCTRHFDYQISQFQCFSIRASGRRNSPAISRQLAAHFENK